MTIVFDDLRPVQVNIIPVPQNLAHGAETAQWIYDQITTYPENWNQSLWEYQSLCGTVRCVAGWASFLNNSLFQHIFGEADAEGYVDPEPFAYIHTGMKALGISEYEARWLFHGFRGAEEVLLALKAIANGEQVPLPCDAENDHLIGLAEYGMRRY